MKKIIIVIPVYNDWESLIKLLDEINKNLNDLKDVNFECIVINDCSTNKSPDLIKPKNISSLTVVNMKKNKGHARCNALGLRYLVNNFKFDHVLLMDGDGEDRPQEIPFLVQKALSEENMSVVAKRIKRSEGFFFQALYQIHKLITIIFTGKNINFGNFSCLTNKDAERLFNKKSLWSSFSGSLKFHISNFNSVNSIRGLRYFGPSKMSLFNLIVHSFSIIAVFKKTVFLRSAFLLILSSYLINNLGLLIVVFQIFLVVFNILIYLVSLRENEEELLKSEENIDSVKVVKH